MVQKSKILGETDLILITTGTTKHNFNRVLSILDEVLIENNLNYKVIIQTNYEKPYHWQYKKTKIYKTLSPNSLINFINKAKKIISHAGVGTVYLIAKYSKINPLIIPRFKEYKEHVDNHQYFFCKYLIKKIGKNIKKIFLINKEYDFIKKEIKKYLLEDSKENLFKKIFIKNKKYLNLNLDKYLKNYEK
jgi:UDP-N-acetylglucosamine transferase subunit ALG13